jgi:hypothetical protein
MKFLKEFLGCSWTFWRVREDLYYIMQELCKFRATLNRLFEKNAFLVKILKDVTKEFFGSEFKHLKSSFLEKEGEIRVQGTLLFYFWFRTYTNIFIFL